MASRKGIIVTVIILAAIAVGSSVIWIFPQNKGTEFVVSDYGNEIEGVKQRHMLIMTEMDSNLKGLLNKTISPDNFVPMAQTSSSQTTSLITELIESNPPAEWRLSYLSYDEALKIYNDYLTETIALADKIKGGASQGDISGETSMIVSLRNDTSSLIERSDKARP